MSTTEEIKADAETSDPDEERGGLTRQVSAEVVAEAAEGEVHPLVVHPATCVGSMEDLERMRTLLRAHPEAINLVSEDVQGGLSPLQHAARAGHLNCLDVLLQAKPDDIDLLDKNSLTAMFYAVQSCQNKCVEILLAYDANPNYQPAEDAFQRGDTFYLKLATMFGLTDTVKTLLENPKIMTEDAMLYTSSTFATSIAAMLGRMEILKLLFLYGADLSNCNPLCENDFQQNSLAYLVVAKCVGTLENRKKMLYMLHQFGVNFWARDPKSGKTALELCLANSKLNEDGKILAQVLADHMKNPLSLQSICRLVIKQCMTS